MLTAVRAAGSKKAQALTVLDLREITSFTEYFLICTALNQRQSQAICDEIHLKMKERGQLPLGVEGYQNAEWILMDYGDFIVHVFLEKAREFYNLEWLWKAAREVELPAGLA